MTDARYETETNEQAESDENEFYVFPASYAQQRLFFLDELMPGNPIYNMPIAVRLQGHLQVAALEQALEEIMWRHESLRTHFAVEGREVMQVISPSVAFSLPLVELTEGAEEQREALVGELADEEAQRPFSLATGPLFRGRLIRVREGDHVLLLTLHHIISDGWSNDVLIQELVMLYQTFAADLPPALPELEIQYADFSEWQREFMESEAMGKQLFYWKEKLGGHLPVLQLPTARPRPPQQTHNGSSHTFRVPKQVTEQLKALSQRAGATLFMTLLAAYKTLLYRYTGQSDLIVGSPIAGRNRGEIEPLIGLFVNTLALRTDMTDATFLDLLERVRHTTLDAFDHQDVPFEKLVAELQPERNMSFPPIFQVMFVLQNTPMREINLPDLTMSLVEANSATAKFDLTLSVSEGEDGLAAHLEYNTDLFDRATIQRMGEHLQRLLASIATHPELEITRLPMVPDAERQQLLAWSERTLQTEPAKCDSAPCIHHRFEQSVAAYPDRIALSYEQEQLTYRELNERANRLAHHLQQQGVGAESLVGVCLDRSLDMIVALLAVLKAGGAYVPLDPTYPEERIAFVLQDAAVDALITAERYLSKAPAGLTAVCVDRDAARIAEQSGDNPNADVNADNLAYVIYTSGSTGKPKGVLIPHRNAVRLFTETEAWYGFHEQDVWTLFHSYAFDFSVWEIWGALFYGGKLVIVPYLTSRSPEAFYELLCAEGVTVLNQTPSAFRQLIAAEELQGISDRLALRYVIFGGEALELQSLAPWFNRHGDQQPRLINMYGITETTVHVTFREITQADVQANRGSVIGVPIPDLQVYVLDAHLEPAPIGVVGELYVGGAGLARGYLNRPELTAERFTANPFAKGSPEATSRLYKTGDLARYLGDGELEYQGRSDHQVKVRGFRIELGEIESALTKLDAVREAVVLVREDNPGDKRLVAYLVAQAGRELPTADLIQALKGELPAYMVPSAFVVLDAFPLTPNGKTDTRALPAPDQGTRAQQEYVAPRNEVERTLADIWASVLKLGQVGIDDRFFEVGGDSILSIQVLAEARRHGLNFTLQDLFRHQTIRDLTPCVTHGANATPEEDELPPFALISEADRALLPDDAQDAFPLVKLQEGMIYHNLLHPESSFYHNVYVFNVRHAFAREAMQQAVAALVQRHPSLRTSFHLTGFSEPMQVVHREVELPLQIRDLREWAEGEQQTQLQAWMEAEKRNHFDLTRAPAVRFHVHLLSDDRFQFAFTEHHAVLDGWSVATMLAELFDLYAKAVAGEAVTDEASFPWMFRDYVRLEREALASDEMRAFWHQRLEDLTVTEVPRRAQEPQGLNGSQEEEETGSFYQPVPISHEVSQGLKRLAEQAGVPVKSVLLAAHLRVLSLLSGQMDVVTGYVVNGRPETVGGEKALGLFLNTLPLRLGLNGGSWVELAQQTFTAEQEVMPYRRYPMAQIQQELGGQALYEVSFNYTHFHVLQSIDNSLDVAGEDGYGVTNFDLGVDFRLDLNTSEVLLALTGSCREYGPTRRDEIAGYYAKTLEAMASSPESRYERVKLLSPQEWDLLMGWRAPEPVASASKYDRDATIHDLFEEQAAARPDAVALAFGSEQVTYRELNERANRLAHKLRELGVGSETPVALFMERSVELYVSLLAVLKAGGAYLALDPDNPQERLLYQLEDVQPSVFLTLRRMEAKWPAYAGKRLCVEEMGEELASYSVANLEPWSKADSLSHIIYTSGSTGQPKGVAIPHRGVSRLVKEQDFLPFSPEDVWMQFAPISFDASTLEIWGSLLTGAKLVIFPPIKPSLEELGQVVREAGVTTLFLTTGLFHQMVEHRGADLGGVRHMVAGGDILSAAHVRRALTELSLTSVVNAYGPTENSSMSTACVMRSVEEVENTVSIGRPINHAEVYVLDEQMQPVPIGAVGELYVGGDGVAHGYWQRPELTRQAFVPNPFGASPEEKLYKTGDLVRWWSDGRLEFLGRRDHQVKIRGFRIELDEIVTLLAQHPALSKAAVIAREDTPGDKRLVAYVVAADEDNVPGTQELKAYLQDTLPPYMLPSFFLLLDELPLTPNGKLDRKALPAPADGEDLGANEYAAPQNEVEEKVAQLFAEVLAVGYEQVSVTASFFELGGHSLLATRLISRIRQAFEREVPLHVLFEAPTVRELASRLNGQESTGHRLPPITPADREQPLKLSFAQERLWFLDQFESGTATYNIPLAFRLQGKLDVGVMESGLREIVRRHDVLRTRYHEVEGEAFQVVAETVDLELAHVDLQASDLSLSAREEKVRELVAAEAMRPFSLTEDLPLRATLIRLDAEAHVLVVTMHHIASDGWSAGVLVQEFAQLYRAGVRGKPQRLPDLPIQYADFAQWQREWLQGEVLDEQLSYWKQQLGTSLPVLNLPTDRPRPAVQTTSGALLTKRWPKSLSADLQTLSQAEDVTLFMTLLAAFNVLLSRYTGQDDVVVGTPIAGRNRAEIEPLIGFFVNTLVLRNDLSGDLSFRQLLQRVRDVTLGAYDHQDVPFEKLVETLQPERDMSQSPLFQVMFVLQNTPDERVQLPDLTLTPVEIGSQTAKFDLTVVLGETEEGLVATCEYNTDLFDRETIDRLMRSLELLLAGAVAQPDERLERLPILTDDEQQRLVNELNATASAYPRDATIHELFEKQAASRPDAVALVLEEQTVTYRDLNERANRLAGYLRELGVGRETPVALFLERSVELIVSLLAILKAGGAYLPLDPDNPPERLQFQLEDVEPPVLVTQRSLQDRCPSFSGRLLCLEELGSELARQNADNLDPLSAADGLSHIIYTSGSTGRPKGVAIPHRGVVRLVTGQDSLTFAESDVWLQFAPISFDASTFEIWGSLLNGAKLVIFPPYKPSLEELGETVREAGVTTLFLTAGLFHQMIEQRLGDLHGVRHLLSGGDVLSVAHVTKALRELSLDALVNAYGPTENTTMATCYAMRRVEDVGSTVSIGRPLNNTEVYVLDGRMQPVPVGVVGELHVGGDGLALGYWKRPELTQEAFVPHPFQPASGKKVYKTGDLVRLMPDGNLEFLGRRDHQVKIRGFRIELGEIETRLSQYPDLSKVAVIAREDTPGDKRLVAYVVARDADKVPSSQDLRSYLQASLPPYMVPAFFVLLNDLPLTANGKLDRGALPAPESSDGMGAREYVAPRNETEEKAAALFADVLGLEQVSITDSFFEIGGHSLLATRLISRIRQQFAVELPLRALFEAPTVERLAARLDRTEENGLHLPPITPIDRDKPLALSFAQERLWFLEQFATGTATYNIPLAFRLQGELDAEALAYGLTEIVSRHEVLRTRYQAQGGQAFQVIEEAEAFALTTVDLRGFSDSQVAREERCRQLVAEEAQRPFSLTEDLPLRAILVRLTDEEQVLVLTMHHIASDGWSTGVLLHELSELYRAWVEGERAQLAPLPIQYADYARWQREWLQGEVLDEQLRYWQDKLGGDLPVMQLPTDRPRPAVQTTRGATVTRRLPASLTTDLHRLSQGESATLFMTLLAAFNVLLYRYTGQDDLLVGTPIAGRTQRELEGLIGFFVNTLVLRHRLSDEMSFRELLQQVREETLEAYAHQDVPFEKVVEVLQPVRDLSYSPLFQVMFALQNAPFGDMAWPSLTVEPLEANTTTAKFDLTLTMVEGDDGLAATMEYNSDLFDAETIERMMDRFAVLLASLAQGADRPLSALPLLDEAAEQELLQIGRGAEQAVPQEPLHAGFERQARQTPDRVALVAGKERLTYRELNERANRLAHRLLTHAQGSKTDEVVALCLERSVEMVVAMLAVLKAGKAYLPLDPSLPPDRLQFMIEDAGVTLLLTASDLDKSLNLDAELCLLIDQASFDTESAADPQRVVQPEDLAYVIYTSGSTGQPKGVMIPHRAIVNHMGWMQAAYPLTAEDRVLQKTPYGFDASVWEFYAPLLAGAQLVMAEPGGHQDPRYLVQAVRDWEITRLQLVPTMLHAMLEEPELAECRTLQHVFCGGEALSPELVDRFHEQMQGRVRLTNLYGPTEACIEVTAWDCRPNATMRTVPIGRPITNLRAYVLDGAGRPVPTGVPGELFLAGAGLARGYLNRPDLTAASFLPDPFAVATDAAGAGASEPARMYKTGDLVRYLADGSLEYLGRIDHQVKIRGYRIELGEIETRLLRHPSVREAVVVARRDDRGTHQLVAYVVPAADAFLQAEDVRRDLRAELPDYMVPAACVFLPSLPLLVNGKVDRKALPAPDASNGDEGRYVAPRDHVELTLARLFEEVLGVERVGVHDDFFARGGHSLLAVRLLAQMREAFGCDLSLPTLFQQGTVENLAQALRNQDGTGKRSSLVQLRGGANAPFYAVHPVGGTAMPYQELARRLEEGQPFYGLEAYGLETDQEPLTSIEELATRYLTDIRAVQPHGPYLLGGWSLGGVIAYEMAQQLRAAGEEVAMLALFDSVAPVPGQQADSVSEQGVLSRFAQEVAFHLHLSLEHLTDSLQAGDADGVLADLLRQAQANGALPQGTSGDQLERLYRVFAANMEAIHRYVPRRLPQDVPVKLFRAADETAATHQHPTTGWSELVTGQLSVQEVSGTHFTFLQPPHVQELVDAWQPHLQIAARTADSLRVR
ncbi:MAG TPA: amino acid adenylation domain-containing protein [Bacilli bacterium]|nr:amino acid adenylation domain-containing protein [Bacilli bacterium]